VRAVFVFVWCCVLRVREFGMCLVGGDCEAIFSFVSGDVLFFYWLLCCGFFLQCCWGELVSESERTMSVSWEERGFESE